MIRIACGLALLTNGHAIRHSAKVEPHKALRVRERLKHPTGAQRRSSRKQRQRLLNQCKNHDAPMAEAPYPDLKVPSTGDVCDRCRINRKIKRS